MVKILLNPETNLQEPKSTGLQINITQDDVNRYKYMDAADVAVAAAKYAKENWNIYKIAKDPDHHGAVFELLDEIDKKKGGAVEVWKRWKNNEFFHRGISKFAFNTGYKVPKTSKTFQEQVTMFKKYFKLNRKKKKVAQFLDKEFKI